MQPQVQAMPVPQVQVFEQMTAPAAVAPAFIEQAQPQIIQAAPATVFETSPAVATFAAPQVIAQPQIQYAPQPQVVSYIPAAAQPQVSSYIPAPVETFAAPQVTQTIVQQPQMVEMLAPGVAPTIAAAPASYIPAPVETIVQGQPQVVSYLPQQPMQVVQQEMPAGQSVIVEQVGDWLVCEDALGIFYHHNPTQQSFDNAPSEFLALFPQGYQPPALGAFAAAGYMPQQVVQQVPMAAPIQQVASYIPAQPQIIETMAPQVIQQPQVASYIPAAQPQIIETMAPQVMQPQVTTQIMQPQILETVLPTTNQVTYAPQAMVQQQMQFQGQPMPVQQPAQMQQLPPVMAKVL